MFNHFTYFLKSYNYFLEFTIIMTNIFYVMQCIVKLHESWNYPDKNRFEIIWSRHVSFYRIYHGTVKLSQVCFRCSSKDLSRTRCFVHVMLVFVMRVWSEEVQIWCDLLLGSVRLRIGLYWINYSLTNNNIQFRKWLK